MQVVEHGNETDPAYVNANKGVHGTHTLKAVTYHEQSQYCRFMIGHSLGRIESRRHVLESQRTYTHEIPALKSNPKAHSTCHTAHIVSRIRRCDKFPCKLYAAVGRRGSNKVYQYITAIGAGTNKV